MFHAALAVKRQICRTLALCVVLTPTAAEAAALPGLIEPPPPFGAFEVPQHGSSVASPVTPSVPEPVATPSKRRRRRLKVDADRCSAGDLRVATAVLEPGQSPWNMMRQLGIAGRDLKAMGRAFRPWVKIRRLQPGHEVRAAFDGDDLVWVRHRVGVREAFCGIRRPRGFEVVASPLPIDRREEVIAGEVDGDWVEALAAVGEARSLGVTAELVFPAKSLGGATRFRLVVEKRYVEDRFYAYGPLQALELGSGDDARRAYRFGKGHGENAFYDASGTPIRASGLPSPVLNAVLTSGYGRRWHPIRRRRKMHRGVDYGAARGEPVFAVATGTVSVAARRRALGRLVTLEHEGGLVTRYAHLRRIARGLRKGARVQTGQLIGYVGSSGMSTGPHLHFETILDGRHVNPLRYRPPAPEPLEGARKAAFLARRERLDRALGKDLVS